MLNNDYYAIYFVFLQYHLAFSKIFLFLLNLELTLVYQNLEVFYLP